MDNLTKIIFRIKLGIVKLICIFKLVWDVKEGEKVGKLWAPS